MSELFARMSHAMEASPALALGAALAWGVLSIVLSPCHLTSIPLLVAYIAGRGAGSTARATGIAGVFALGVLVTILGIGAVTAAAGRVLGDTGPWGDYLVVAVFVLVGLYLLDVVSLPAWGFDPSGGARKGLLGGFLLGLVFGAAVGPCTFAFMAPVLAAAFRASQTSLPFATGLLLLYGVGHCGVIVLAGSMTGLVQRMLAWQQASRKTKWLRRGCGVVMILVALYMLYKAR